MFKVNLGLKEARMWFRKKTISWPNGWKRITRLKRDGSSAAIQSSTVVALLVRVGQMEYGYEMYWWSEFEFDGAVQLILVRQDCAEAGLKDGWKLIWNDGWKMMNQDDPDDGGGHDDEK